jgi:hypothetical protein
VEWFLIYVVVLVQPVLLLLLWCVWDTYRHRRRRVVPPSTREVSEVALTPLVAVLQAQFCVAPCIALREASALVPDSAGLLPAELPSSPDERARLFRSLVARIGAAEGLGRKTHVV